MTLLLIRLASKSIQCQERGLQAIVLLLGPEKVEVAFKGLGTDVGTTALLKKEPVDDTGLGEADLVLRSAKGRMKSPCVVAREGIVREPIGREITVGEVGTPSRVIAAIVLPVAFSIIRSRSVLSAIVTVASMRSSRGKAVIAGILAVVVMTDVPISWKDIAPYPKRRSRMRQ